ncbi:M20/M25/M40 family metallo-hydrolase [Aureisphaera sp. CAU 1614]|uniref:Vacuolar membrane protease n=1 Tax=Halomarinibacterium sedimenti TaxID=2857106 RepID=A0A9X1JWL6_9FLAO|nr:M20/M25/M40 family metallo-hydrolase [Halomarinibacterium sedimenti]MBW2937143.1 M20/M25/M40 family metallo-hydrolase [Halomarinibacterium sedimenti]
MKRSQASLSLLLLIGLIYYSFYSLMPREGTPATLPETEFSTERALIPLKEIAKAPHYIGTEENIRVREYLIEQLKVLGLQPETQEGYILNEKWGGMDKPVNILAKIEGIEKGKALLIFSHYDSALVPSPGASDAGSGVVTILETIRAFNASGKQPKNDIIILFTDGEEVGLDGAKLFVREHPWAKNVGLALNFEARGSGGPSNMIVETNQGNKNLIQGFIEANPEYPVASSLMYSIYKMLPNDTDSTVLREEGDIDGLFFAFIDDHFDYHTANDNYERLDRKTLQHQGSYLLPLMHYFSNADLSQIKSEEDYVYVNIPFVKMISYPFSWVLPMAIGAFVIFIILIFYGLKNGRLSGQYITKGFVPFLLSLVISGLAGYFGWELILKLYPRYEEIQHGFTYNGHTYIAFFVVVTLAITFGFYTKFSKRIHPSNLLIAPLFFWLLINIGVAIYLKGAAFFVIPVFFALLSLWILIRQEFPNLLLMLLLAVPAVFIFSPLIQFFPVGLGLEMLLISCVFTVLLFGLLLTVIGFYKYKKLFSALFIILAIGFFISAHFNSQWTETTQKPNSLIYYQDTDAQKAYWVTYDNILDDWTRGYLGDNPKEASNYVESAAGSKYNTGYTFASEAPFKDIPKFDAFVNTDTILGEERSVSFTIYPKREVDVIRLYADKSIVFNSLSYNGKSVAKDSTGKVYSNRVNNGLISYYVSPNDTLQVNYSVPKDVEVTFNVLEYSFDLMKNPQFTMAERPKNTMTKPFVFTDAIVMKRLIDRQTLQKRVVDTLKTVADE